MAERTELLDKGTLYRSIDDLRADVQRVGRELRNWTALAFLAIIVFVAMSFVWFQGSPH